jgi:hypothetical protein
LQNHADMMKLEHTHGILQYNGSETAEYSFLGQFCLRISSKEGD